MSPQDPSRFEKPRTVLRTVGPILLGIGILLTVIAFLSFVNLFVNFGNGSASDGPPMLFFLGFLGLPMIAIGGWMTQVGYLKPIAEYAAEETAAAVATSVSAARRGWEEGGEPSGEAPQAEPGRAVFCSSCGVKNDLDAKFCDSCGAKLSRPD